MVAIATLLMILTLSLLFVRVATVMLVLTGISLPLARFQARSAFTSTGFTTGESEQVVNHPVRRRIISTLMLLGNAGIITTVGTLIAGVTGVSDTQELRLMPDGSYELITVAPDWPLWQRLVLLGAGIAGLWVASSSRFVERLINRVTLRLLRKYTKLEVRDYANLMHLSGDYGINELLVQKGDWLAGRPLAELRLTREGIVVLGIQRRDGTYLGAPRAETVAAPGDVMIVYGRAERLAELDNRRADPAGVLRHVEAVADQRVRKLQEQEIDAREPQEKAAAERALRQAEQEHDAVRAHAATAEVEQEESARP